MSKRKSISGTVRRYHRERTKRSAMAALEGKSIQEIAASIKGIGTPLLKSKSWKDLKKRVYSTYGYRCMKCGILPKDKRHSNVDHIKPRKLFPDLALEFDNLQVLCGRCNKEKGNSNCIDYRPIAMDAEGELSDHNIGRMLKML